MRKIWVLLGLMVTVQLTAVACGDDDVSGDSDRPVESRSDTDGYFFRETVDGIDCIVWDGYKAGGLSCDWE